MPIVSVPEREVSMRMLVILIAFAPMAWAQPQATQQAGSTDVESALQNLKTAEANKDLDGIKKWAEAAFEGARKLESTPDQAAYAKQVEDYADYALYSVAAGSRDPKVTIDFATLLEQTDPKSQYVPKVESAVFVAYRQSGNNDKALAVAEKALATDQSDEDMLLAMADHYLQTKKEPEKVHAYCARLVQMMPAKPKPEGVSDADWAARRNLIMGLAHYMDGKQYYTEAKYPQADTELRAALPLVESNAAVKAESLYYLGFANYKMEKPQEAANYYRECAAMKGPLQATAAKNLQGIKTQFHGIK